MNKIVNGVANDYEFDDIGYYREINIPARQIGKTFQVINMYEQKYKQLQSNWNSLRELIEKQREQYRYFKDNRYRRFLSELVDKMNELEGEDNV